MTSQSRNYAVRHNIGVHPEMVLCVVIGCSKHSGCDKDVSFYRILKIITHRRQQDYELSKKQRDAFFAAISRDRLTEKTLTNDKISSAALYDETNPTFYLGHYKSQNLATERWERRRARRAKTASACTLLTLATAADSNCEQDIEQPFAEQEAIATQTDILHALKWMMQSRS